MSKLKFVVEGVPPQIGLAPKKHPTSKKNKKRKRGSIWSDETEQPRLIELRDTALATFPDRRPTPFEQRVGVRLTFRVCLKDENAGRLENFVSGVCDGLGKANPDQQHQDIASAALEQLEARYCVKPYDAIAFGDDSQVVEILATKQKIDDSWCRDKNGYEVEVEKVNRSSTIASRKCPVEGADSKTLVGAYPPKKGWIRKEASSIFAAPFCGNVSLTLRAYVRDEESRRGSKGPGDLDNLLWCVCSGLFGVAFKHYKQIHEIFATRTAGDDDWYEVEVAEVKPKEEKG